MLTLARQHVGPAGEMRLRRAVAHVDLVVGGLQKLLPDRRGQALAQHDCVALAMFEALDADLLVLVRDRGIGRPGNRDVGRKIRLSRELLGKVETDARRGRFVVDLVIENAEAVLGAHGLVGLAHVDCVAPVQRRLQGVKRRAPKLVARQKVCEHGKRCGLRVRRRRAQIGGVGRGRPASDELITVVRLRVVGLDRDARVSEPVRGVLGSGGDRRARELFGGVEVCTRRSRRRRPCAVDRASCL